VADALTTTSPLLVQGENSRKVKLMRFIAPRPDTSGSALIIWNGESMRTQPLFLVYEGSMYRVQGTERPGASPGQREIDATLVESI
jgi:hypothetical protein